MSDEPQQAEQDGAIVPVEERTIDFYGDPLVAVRDKTGMVWVPVRPIAQQLGLDWSAQYRRIQRDPILSESAKGVAITTTPSTSKRGGGPQETLCLPLDMLHGWLFGVSADRVREELREKVLRYQRECYRVLARAFTSTITSGATIGEREALAMRDLALQQARLWETIAAEQRRLRATEAFVEDLDDRLHDVDKAVREIQRIQAEQGQTLARLVTDPIRLLPDLNTPITPAQQSSITGLVNDLASAAQLRGQRLGQGKSDHAAVWATLKRRFNVAKYQDLTQAQYGQVVSWLETWLQRIRTNQ